MMATDGVHLRRKQHCPIGSWPGTIIDYGISSNTQTYTFQFRAKAESDLPVDHSEIIDRIPSTPRQSQWIHPTHHPSFIGSRDRRIRKILKIPDIPTLRTIPRRDRREVDLHPKGHPSSELPEVLNLLPTFKGDEVLEPKPQQWDDLLYGIDESFQYAF